MTRMRRVASACVLAIASAAAHADFKGELDVEASHARNTRDSVDAALGEREHSDESTWLRLMGSGTSATGWGFDLAYLVEARHGGQVAIDQRERELEPELFVDPQRTAPLRLSDTLLDHERDNIAQRLDRFALSYTGTHLVLRLGRQALTWGGGLVFHPMDLFNPFSPNATYTAYKPGADMVYGQWLFDSGADVQFVAVPRRDPSGGAVVSDQSSAGLKWHGMLGADQTLGLDVLLARDYRADVLGVALGGAIGGASWNAEVVPTRDETGATRTSLLANLQYAWSWGTRNASGYVEYFRNGFGVSGGGHVLSTLPAALSERLARGELFTVSRNYLAAGLDLQWTPLLDFKPLVIANLDDHSMLWVGQAVYSVSQNVNLTAGIQLTGGSRGSEYGGLPIAPGFDTFDVPQQRVYARVTWYFQ